jgi:hypothetical protein
MHFDSWDEFNENTKNNPPRSLCQEAVELVAVKNRALDVGAGALNDAKYLLSKGFNVLAIDFNPSVITIAATIDNTRLQATVVNLEEFRPPPNTFDYVNAMFVLPFIKTNTFNDVFDGLYGSLAQDGVMAFQLFGDQDDWAKVPANERFHKNMTFLTSMEVDRLLADKKVIKCEETIKDDRLAKGGLIVRRELHFDENDNWHYLLAHAAIDATPTDDDIISDLNPWQWRDFGGGILHGSRQDVMETLRTAGAPENVIALRGLHTIRAQHHIYKNPHKS